ncbi:MAG TPA: hypothetical protein VIY49_19175 [Bryobacteraceae bacterium]
MPPKQGDANGPVGAVARSEFSGASSRSANVEHNDIENPEALGLLTPGTEEYGRTIDQAREEAQKADDPELKRRQRRNADMQARSDRYHGRLRTKADLQEKLIRDARLRVEGYLEEARSHDARIRITERIHEEYKRDYGKKTKTDGEPVYVLLCGELYKAIWTEGCPSLEERVSELVRAPQSAGETQDILSAKEPPHREAETGAREPQDTHPAASGDEEPVSAAVPSNNKPKIRGSTRAETMAIRFDWEHVEVVVTDHKITISIGNQERTLHYKQVRGFCDKRKALPNEQWLLLTALGGTHGCIPERARYGKDWLKTQKHVERLRKALSDALKEHFGFTPTGDPIPHFKDTGYHARFKVTVESDPAPEIDGDPDIMAERERAVKMHPPVGRGERGRGIRQFRESQDD